MADPVNCAGDFYAQLRTFHEVATHIQFSLLLNLKHLSLKMKLNGGLSPVWGFLSSSCMPANHHCNPADPLEPNGGVKF